MDPLYSAIRKATLFTLILAAVVLTFASLLSIWDVFDQDVKDKALASIVLFVFSSSIIVILTLWQDGLLSEARAHSRTPFFYFKWFLFFVVGWWFFQLFFGIFSLFSW